MSPSRNPNPSRYGPSPEKSDRKADQIDLKPDRPGEACAVRGPTQAAPSDLRSAEGVSGMCVFGPVEISAGPWKDHNMDELTGGLFGGALLTVASWPATPGDWIRTAIAFLLLTVGLVRLVRDWRRPKDR